MRTRHRMPMIFSLSMMDVFCCTLGCVILLWLVNQREAMLRTRAASEVTDRLEVTRATLAADLEERLTTADARIERLQKVADTLPELRDAAASARESMAGADSRTKALERDLADARRALDTAKAEGRDLAGQVARIRTA